MNQGIVRFNSINITDVVHIIHIIYSTIVVLGFV